MPCEYREALRRWHDGLVEIRARADIGGLEKAFCIVLYHLRLISISEWLSFCLTGGRETSEAQNRDRLIVDCYVVGKTFFLFALILVPELLPVCLLKVVVSYLLIEMYVQLFNIVFIGTLEAERQISTGRSLLLLLFNGAQLVMSFALLYWVAAKFEIWTAIYWSIKVFGTIGFPEDAPKLATLQIALDFIFLAVILAKFIGLPERRRQI